MVGGMGDVEDEDGPEFGIGVQRGAYGKGGSRDGLPEHNQREQTVSLDDVVRVPRGMGRSLGPY